MRIIMEVIQEILNLILFNLTTLLQLEEPETTEETQNIMELITDF